MIFVDFFRKDKKLLRKKIKIELMVVSLDSPPKHPLNSKGKIRKTKKEKREKSFFFLDHTRGDLCGEMGKSGP